MAVFLGGMTDGNMMVAGEIVGRERGVCAVWSGAKVLKLFKVNKNLWD